MPRVTIYVPDDLNAEARTFKVPISATCQAALRAAVTQVRSTMLSDSDRDAIAARLRSTREEERRNLEEFGRRTGVTWARDTATLTELEYLYRATSRGEWLHPLAGNHSAQDVIWEARDPHRDGDPEDYDTLDFEDPFDLGFVNGARSVYEQVRELL